MQKHLSWFPWVVALLIAGILACVICLIYALCLRAPREAYAPGAILVREAMRHAAIF